MPEIRTVRPQAERRFLSAAELRASREGATPRLVGYAARFDSESDPVGGWFVEVIRRGAFTETLRNGDDIRSLFNHDPNYVLGRRASKTLTLTEDQNGLYQEVEPPDTQWARDLVVSVERGDITQQSFGFYTLEDRWTFYKEPEKLPLRELLKVELFDVSVVTFPQYPETDAAVRLRHESSREVFERALARHAPSDAEIRLRLRLAEAEA